MELTAPFKNPVFGNAFRILQFRRLALARRTPWALRDAAAELEVSTKSIKRYVAFLGLVDTDGHGEPLLTFQRIHNRTHIVSRAKRRASDAR